MDLNDLTWLMVTCLLFQMHSHEHITSPSSHAISSWHPDQVHLPLFHTLHWRGEEVPCNFAILETLEELMTNTVDTIESPHVVSLDASMFSFTEQWTSAQREELTQLLIHYGNTFSSLQRTLESARSWIFPLILWMALGKYFPIMQFKRMIHLNVRGD